jgi:hypothetical protein
MECKQLGFSDYELNTANKQGLLKKSDRLRCNWFQRSRPAKLASYWAINDCCNS